MIDTISYWILLNKYTAFLTNKITWILQPERLVRIICVLILQVLSHVQRTKTQRHQPNNIFSHNVDINDCNEGEFSESIANTPVFPVYTTKKLLIKYDAS